MPEPINIYQRLALDVYGDGDFSYIETYSFDDKHGDALLTFVLAELSDAEGCEDMETAVSRIEKGIEDLQTVLRALEARGL